MIVTLYPIIKKDAHSKYYFVWQIKIKKITFNWTNLKGDIIFCKEKLINYDFPDL
jgi:hypothetical protein